MGIKNGTKRVISKIENSLIVEKIIYESWCDHLFISSYFINNEILIQLKMFYPETLLKVK